VNPLTSQNVIAAFDFDGTLTYHDTFFPFLKYVCHPFNIASGLFFVLPYLPLGCFYPYYRQRAKEMIISKTLRGTSLDLIKKKGDEFARGILQTQLRPEGIKKLHWHQQQGHRCILISANLDVYLEPWALQAGFHNLICSKVEVDSHQILNGKLSGSNCWGAEKTKRLLQLAGPKDNFTLYAYGNSRGDKELLDLADYPFYRTFEMKEKRY
jgi:phosphatidylglycerophosphatase C